MKNLTKFLVLIIGMTSLVTMAQNADSVIVIYKNQKTIIPVPAYKSQSSISYSDSIRVVEIGVSQRKPGDISLFPQHPYDILAIEKRKSNSKWFSQIEVGYLKGFTEFENEYSFTLYDVSIPITQTFNNRMTDAQGYQIRLLLHEREYYFDKKKSFTSGFIGGYSQSFLQVNQIYTYHDTTNNPPIVTETNFDFRINSLQFMYKMGLNYQITTWKLPARISFGNYLGFSITRIKDKNDKFHPSYSHINTTLLQPYLGLEISKIGILFSADLNVPKNIHYILFDNDIGGNIAISLTYRIF